MNLTRPLISLDVETTGVDVVKDRIIELGLIYFSPDGKVARFEQRFNPGVPIAPEATEVHHITDADVKDCPPFSAFAKKIFTTLSGRDLVGYNLRRLDLPMIDEELRRCDYRLDLRGVQVVDAAGIFFKQNPRNLEAAVLRYCHRAHEGAHGAGDDAAATLEVLWGQLREHGELGPMTLQELAEYSNLSDKPYADLAGKLYRDPDGDLCFAFGQHRDEKVRNNYDYYRWMVDKGSFPGSTIDALLEEAEKLRREKTAK